MEKREIKISDVLKTRGLTIIPVVEICLRYRFDSDRTVFYYSRKPVVIYIETKHGGRAVGINGEDFPFSRLIEMAPEIDSVLHSSHDHI